MSNILTGTGYQPKPTTGKHVLPPPKHPNTPSTPTEKEFTMSDANKAAVKAITKEHKDKIKLFTKDIEADILETKNNLPEVSIDGVHVTIKSVNVLIKSFIQYLKACKALANNELDSLAESLVDVNEDPVTELTKDAYNLIKKIIVDNSHDLSTELIKNIESFISDSGYNVQVSRKNMLAIADIVRVTVSRDVFSTIQLLDEEIVTVETVSIDELKKENASLKAKLATIEALTK